MSQKVPFYNGMTEANCDYHHGQVPLLPGVKCYQVTRGNRGFKELADGTTSTYKHGADLTYFHGKFYIQYLCNPVDEHYEAGYSVLASSADGKEWNDFKVSFPEYPIKACRLVDYKGIVHEFDGTEFAFMHQRMSFYRSSSDRMLVLGFYGYSPEKWMTNWDNYGIGRVVRELYPDGTFSDIYFIRPNFQAGWSLEQLNYPMYHTCEDCGFVKACEELLASPLVTQQWSEENGDADEIIAIKHPKEGKKYEAFCSYHIDEKNVVGLWKHSFVARSTDGGKTFGQVVQSPSLVMSGQKIWGQKLTNGKFMLNYVPTLESQHRYPLAAVISEDGICFDDMRLVHGEVPPMRYAGFWKDFGPQYMRGISEGHTTQADHPDEAYAYLVYSVNKEDIWISHIPVNGWNDSKDGNSLSEDSGNFVQTDVASEAFERMGFGGRDWRENLNIYQPKWTKVDFVGEDGVYLEDREPLDYVHVQKALTPAKKKTISFEIKPTAIHQDGFYIELLNEKYQPAVRLILREHGNFNLRTTAEINVCKFTLGDSLFVQIVVDCERYESELLVKNQRTQEILVSRTDRFMGAVREICSISFKSGPARRMPNLDTNPDTYVDLDRTLSEQPGKPLICEIYRLSEV